MKHRAWLKPSGTPQIHRTKCLCQLKKAQPTITSKLPPTYETISPAQPTNLEPREVTSFYFLTNANSLERFLHSDLLEFLSSEPNRIFRHTRHLPFVWSPGKNFRGTYWVCASITFPCFSTCKIQILNLAHLKEPAPPTSSPLSFLYQTQGTITGAVAAGGKIARTVAFPTNLQASSSSIWLPWDRAIIPPCPPGPGETRASQHTVLQSWLKYGLQSLQPAVQILVYKVPQNSWTVAPQKNWATNTSFFVLV